MFFRFTFNSFF